MVKHFFLFTGLMVAGLLLASSGLLPYKCTDPLGCLEIPPGSPVVIGAILATNGHTSLVGTACMESIAEVITYREILLGHPLQLERYSTDGTPESAWTAATEAARDPVLLAVVGPSLDVENPDAIPILSNAGIPSLSPVPDPAAGVKMVEEIIAALVQVALQRPDKTLIIPRLALREALAPSP